MKSGHAHSRDHFTGKKSGPGKKRKRKSSRKQRREVRGSHINKYSHLAPEKKDRYRSEDKNYRKLPLKGEPSQIIHAGLVYLWHGRRYRLLQDVIIPDSGESYGKFKMIGPRADSKK